MRLLALCLNLAVAGLLAGCQTAPFVAVEREAANLLLPPSQEKQLGAQVAGEVARESKFLEDPEVVRYVTSIGQRVAAASPNPDKWAFTFKVIDDPKTINAFAIPGGSIYVYTGLIKAAKDEAELAGVLAHEVAHVTSRHIARRMVSAYGLQALAGVALGKDPGLLQKIGAAIVVNGTLLKNSRDDESESDAKGVVALAKAGYDPQGMVGFFETLKRQEGSTPAVLAFLSDHPTSADRIVALRKEIQAKRLTGDQRNVEAYQAIQKRLP